MGFTKRKLNDCSKRSNKAMLQVLLRPAKPKWLQIPVAAASASQTIAGYGAVDFLPDPNVISKTPFSWWRCSPSMPQKGPLKFM